MTKSAAKELAPLHIRVNAVAPGIVKRKDSRNYTKPTAIKSMSDPKDRTRKIRHSGRCGQCLCFSCLRQSRLYFRTDFRGRRVCGNLNISNMFLNIDQKNPADIAAIDDHEDSLTYGELVRFCDHLGRY